ncbi:MAG: hypothetical protein ACKOW3_06165 [Hyphomicrobium sp.]
MFLYFQKIGILNTALQVVFFSLFFYSFSAKSEGYCVACYSPDVVYQCVIEGKKNTSSVDPRHQILCIKLIAQDGGHERCSVERFTNEGCKGTVKIVDADTSTLKLETGAKTASSSNNTLPKSAPLGTDAEIEGNATDESKEMSSPASSSTGSTGPVENLTKSALQTTKNGFSAVTDAIKNTTVKTGDKIKSFAGTLGNATKKTWHCVTSLFTNC